MPNVHITGAAVGTFTTFNGLRLLTYSPAKTLPATVFPKSADKDYQRQVGMILEKWRRFYPLVPWSQLKFTLDNGAAPPDYTVPTGKTLAGGTLIDPLYGEAIPQYSDNPVEDPVLAGTGAANPKQFLAPIPVNVCLRRDVKQSELKSWGFDELRGAIAIIPLALLDQKQIIVRVGDEFDWGKERFTVMQKLEAGYWKNSTSALYLVMNCETVTRGS